MVLNQLIGGGNQQQPASNWSSDERDFTEDDFMDGDIDLTGNGHELIGEFKVGADQKMEFGHGNKNLAPMEQGRPFGEFFNANSEQIHGNVRFLHVSAQEGRRAKVRDISTKALDESTPTERKVFERASKPARPGRGVPPATQDAFLRIKLQASNLSGLSGSSKVSQSDTTLTIPVTVWERS